MRRRTTIAALATIAMAFALVGWLGSGGSAAPTSDRPSKQELARKLLDTKGLQLTPAARAFVARVAEGGERAAEPEGAEAPRAKAGAATAAGPTVRPAGPGLRNVRVNDPARDRRQQDQTTQSLAGLGPGSGRGGGLGRGRDRLLRGRPGPLSECSGAGGVRVNRPDRQARRRRGKPDPVDAEAAARAVQAGQATAIPKSGDQLVEMVRCLRVARATAVKSRSQAANALRALLVTALRSCANSCEVCPLTGSLGWQHGCALGRS